MISRTGYLELHLPEFANRGVTCALCQLLRAAQKRFCDGVQSEGSRKDQVLGIFQGKYIRKEKLTQALNCSCISELNTGAFTINFIVYAPVFSSDIQLQFSA